MSRGRRPDAGSARRVHAPTALRATPVPHERWWIALILAAHVALAVWGAARNSVTFDENFHLPSGIMIVARGDFGVSTVNPPLVKALCAVPRGYVDICKIFLAGTRKRVFLRGNG